MISNEQIKRAIEDCARANHTISVRDISYVLLSMQFDDSLVAYKCIFGNDYDYNQDYHTTYDQTSTMTYLKSYVEFTLLNDKKKKTKTEDISFEENKAYMLGLKKQTEEAMAAGEIDKKDGLKILADLSVKLNDKFLILHKNNPFTYLLSMTQCAVVVEQRFHVVLFRKRKLLKCIT